MMWTSHCGLLLGHFIGIKPWVFNKLRVVLAVMPALLAACGSPPIRSSPPVVATPRPEMALATAQLGHVPGRYDPLAQQFAQHLDALQRKCASVTRGQLATFTTSINQLLATHHIQESLLDTIAAVDAAVPTGGQSDSCVYRFAEYGALRLQEH
jgi:hypothetical protein